MKKFIVSKRIGLILLLAIFVLPLCLLLVIFNSPSLQLRLFEQMKPLAQSYGIDFVSSPKHFDLRGKIEWPDFSIIYKDEGSKVTFKASSLQLAYSIDWWDRKIHFSNIEATGAVLDATLAAANENLHEEKLHSKEGTVIKLDSLPVSLERAALNFKTINILWQMPSGKADIIQLSHLEASLTKPENREHDRQSLSLKTKAEENIIDAFGIVLQPRFAIQADISEIKGSAFNLTLDGSFDSKSFSYTYLDETSLDASKKKSLSVRSLKLQSRFVSRMDLEETIPVLSLSKFKTTATGEGLSRDQLAIGSLLVDVQVEDQGTLLCEASLNNLLWPGHLRDKINLQVTFKGVTADGGKSATIDYSVNSDKTEIIKAQLLASSKIESQGIIELPQKLLRQISFLAPLRPYARSYSLPYSFTLTPEQSSDGLNDLLGQLTKKALLDLFVEPQAKWTTEYLTLDQLFADLKLSLQTGYSSEGIEHLEASIQANNKKPSQKLGKLTIRTKIDSFSQLAATFDGELLDKKGKPIAGLQGSLFDREGKLTLQWSSDVELSAIPLSPVRAFNANSSFVANHRVASIGEITDWDQIPVRAALNISVTQPNPASSLTLDPSSQLELKGDGNFKKLKWTLASKLTGTAVNDLAFKGVSLGGSGDLNLDDLTYSAIMDINKGQLQILNQASVDLKMTIKARGRPELSQIEAIDFTLGDDLLKLSATGQVGSGDSQLEGMLRADIGKRVLNLNGSELSGALKLPFYISAIDNRDYTFDGTLVFEKVSLKNKSITIQSATGTLPLAERLIATERGFSFPTLKVRTPFERVDFPSLQSLISKKGVLKIEKIIFEDKVLAPVYLVSNLQQNLISLNRFFLQAGPSMIDGEAHINLMPSNFQFSLLTRLEDVRFSDVLPKSMIGGNSLSKDPLSGRAGLLIDLNNSTVNGRVDLSHIKRSQIFNLLELVDPEHKDSQLQSLRSVLSAGATPRSLTLTLAEGLMNIRSEFPVISSIEIKSVPVSGIVQSSLKPLNKALREVPLNESSTSTTASP